LIKSSTRLLFLISNNARGNNNIATRSKDFGKADNRSKESNSPPTGSEQIGTPLSVGPFLMLNALAFLDISFLSEEKGL
jgi:hypothetical protein